VVLEPPATPASDAAPDAASDPLDAAWQRLEARWDDDAAHKAFVGLAHSLERLPDAAHRYRAAMADPRDARAPKGREGLDRVLAVAMLQLEPVKRPPAVGRIAWVVPLCLGGLMVMVAVTASRVLQLPRLASPPALLAIVALTLLIPWRRAPGSAPPS